MSKKITVEIFSVEERLPDSGTYEEPHKVLIWDEEGCFLGDADFYAKRTPQLINRHNLKGLKGFLQYIGDEEHAECFPNHWCEIPNLEKQTLESASADVHFSSAGSKPAVSK